MKFIYPAVFTPHINGSFSSFFPDLADCISGGETLEEAIEKANEAAENWIRAELDEEHPDLPPVSEASDLTLEEGQVVRYIQVNIRFYDGWDE